MSKHTPGPWIAPQEGLVCREADWRDPQIGALSAGFQVQVSMKHGKARAEADARLIAAAPDLLEALQRIAVCAEGQEPTAEMKIAQHTLKKLGLE